RGIGTARYSALVCFRREDRNHSTSYWPGPELSTRRTWHHLSWTSNMAPPLMDMEVITAAKSAWGYELRGENFVGGGGAFVTCPPAVVDDLSLNNPDAFVLLMVARRHHWDRERFCLANAMGEKLGWTVPRLRSARSHLVKNGNIIVLH